MGDCTKRIFNLYLGLVRWRQFQALQVAQKGQPDPKLVPKDILHRLNSVGVVPLEVKLVAQTVLSSGQLAEGSVLGVGERVDRGFCLAVDCGDMLAEPVEPVRHAGMDGVGYDTLVVVGDVGGGVHSVMLQYEYLEEKASIFTRLDLGTLGTTIYCGCLHKGSAHLTMPHPAH